MLFFVIRLLHYFYFSVSSIKIRIRGEKGFEKILQAISCSALTPRPNPGGIFFIRESFVLQHAAAICEWIFTILILVYYGTFTYEFGSVTSDTMMAALVDGRPHDTSGPGVIMGGMGKSVPVGCGARSMKSPGGSSNSTHLNCTQESVAML